MSMNSNSPISSDQEDPIEINDFTVSTDWEKFISELELTLRKWGFSKDDKVSQILNSSKQQEHTLQFDSQNYLLKYYNCQDRASNEKEKKSFSSGTHRTQEQIKNRSNDFLSLETTNIPSLFGVSEFLLLQPESEVMSISLATCILSSCIISINSCERINCFLVRSLYQIINCKFSSEKMESFSIFLSKRKNKKPKSEKIFGVVGKITSKLSKSSDNELFLPKYTQNDLLVMLFTEENNLQRSFSNDIHDFNPNKNKENKFVNEKEKEKEKEKENEKGKEKEKENLNEEKKIENENENGKENETESKKEKEKAKEKENGNEKGKENDYEKNENLNEFKKIFNKLDYLLKTCPHHCLLSEFALYCAFQDSLGDVALLWREFCRAISWYCKSNRIIPKIPVTSPDLGCCILYQKLQLINLCIEKKIRLAKRNEMENKVEKVEDERKNENENENENEKEKENLNYSKNENENENENENDNKNENNENENIKKEEGKVEEINDIEENKEKREVKKEDLEDLDLDIIDDFENDYESSEIESLNDDISSLSSSESDEDLFNNEKNNEEIKKKSENETKSENENEKEKENENENENENEEEEEEEKEKEKEKENGEGTEEDIEKEIMNQEEIIRELAISKITPIFDSQKLFEDKVVYERVGNKKIIEGLTLIKTGEEMWIPETQEPLYLTEDALQAQLELFVKLGTDKQATDIRAKIQSVQLLSDMQAFKAANPGCILEDFVRWYSPRDFIQATNSETGELSERMKKPENIWVKTWNFSKPIPAKDQQPLFDPIRESEKALLYLENLKPNELLEHEIGKSHFNKLLKKFKKVELELLKAHSILKKFNDKDEFLQRYINSKNGMIPIKTKKERELISILYNSNKKNAKKDNINYTRKLYIDDEKSMEKGNEDNNEDEDEDVDKDDEKTDTFLNTPSVKKYILRTTVPRPVFSETPLIQRYSANLSNGDLKISSSLSEEYL
ncbi:rab3 gtpase-activating protein catalytic subunit [Anaeramoeba flamelloides]|uniref:Rab3 GTPase-activating protein catalytic subunit n=1 Tax=Anaeramoeba flamelloides TaxID=1746091 RepID=A0ABQ8Z3V5_9EUKA|nr:rab3 gtpase-activating protein catalytic subunit [Anaeramoeba flamelloides]